MAGLRKEADEARADAEGAQEAQALRDLRARLRSPDPPPPTPFLHC